MMNYLRTLFFLVALLVDVRLWAQVFPADFARVLVTNSVANPTAIAFAPDGRIFVAEQAGKLRVIKNDVLLATSFLQLTVSSSGERGLIGITLDPDFSTNNYIYLYYTVPGTPAHNRVSRFTANGDVAVPGSEFVVLELDPLSNATNHNGGAMHFGKDGKLYIAVGENANSSHAQNLDTYHGKLLRLNKDGSVPDGNPFPTGSEQRKRIWSYGLRNPFTFSVHPASGRILVNDVGQGAWEEINDATTGGNNFGWPTTEGKFNASAYPTLTNPIYAYPQAGGDGNGCAITGGTFFFPSVTNYPAMYLDKYFFQDLCNQWINTLDLTGATAIRSPFATAVGGNNVALTTGNDGNLYYLSRSSNALYKIIYNNTTTPYLTAHPASVTVAEGQSATFTAGALGTSPLAYQWQKNGIDIPGATSATFVINTVTAADVGEFKVVISNSAGSVTSNGAALSVIANKLPIAEILTPVSGTTYAAGTTVAFSGKGDDEEDGALAPPAFQWQVNFHHDTHKHDAPPILGVVSGNFLIPNEGETSDNVWYRIILTVIDSDGLTGKDSIDIYPRKSVITLLTNPPGLEITVDGQPFETPLEITSVEGLLRTFGVNTPQEINGAQYEFASWSNDGETIQTLPTPSVDLQLVANFSTIVGAEDDWDDMDIVLYPNPAKGGFVNVQIRLAQPEEVSIEVTDLLSRFISSGTHMLSSGEHLIPIHFEKPGNGIYLVTVTTANETHVKKLAIMD